MRTWGCSPSRARGAGGKRRPAKTRAARTRGGGGAASAPEERDGDEDDGPHLRDGPLELGIARARNLLAANSTNHLLSSRGMKKA